MSAPVENLVERLHAKRSGKGWIANCPAHDDGTPSLSIDEGADGRALLKCHAGCSTDDVLAALGLTRRDLFPAMSQRQSVNGARTTLNWRECGEAFTDKHLERLAKWRGYSIEFCHWLKESGLVGLYDGCIAFPVHDRAGNVIAAHYRLKDGSWRYFPQGAKVRPLVIGELVSGDPIHLFESYWDAFAFMEVSGERSGIIVTRGASHAALVADLISQSSAVYLWTQNDPAGEKWQRHICANTKATVKRARIPAPHKDLNDWTRAGATADDSLAAMVNAEVIQRSQKGNDRSAESQERNQAQHFPLECLGDRLSAMARAVCETERVPESLAGCCALGVLSASVGAGLQVQSGPNRVTRGNLYILASGQSGSGKSECFRHMARPFFQFEAEKLDEWRAQVLPGLQAERDILESEIAALKKDAGKPYETDDRADIKAALERKKVELAAAEESMQPPMLSCEDVTTERLAVLLSRRGECLASFSPDGGTVVNNLLGRYSKLNRTDETIYLKAFSGDYCRVDRQGREPVVLHSPCVSALWLVQPDKVETLLAERSLTDGGLIPRLCVCHTHCEAREIADNAPTIPNSVSTAYADLIRSLLEAYRLGGEPFLIYPTTDALQAMNAHYNVIVKRRRADLRDVTSYAARWNEQAWRIAVCLHAAKHGGAAHDHSLDLETVQRAMTLADWLARQQLDILQSGRTQRKMARVERLRTLIVQQYKGTATLRDLKKNNGFEPDEVRELAGTFPQLLEIDRRETGGRPSEIVRLPKT